MEGEESGEAIVLHVFLSKSLFILPNKCNLLTDLRPDNEVWNVESESETSSLPNWMTEANMFWRVSNAQRVPDGAKYVWKSRDTSGK